MAANVGSVAPQASLVGNTFVSKYFNVLHQSPQVLYRFYTDQSILSLAEVGANGAIDIVIGQTGINQKIMSLDYIDFRAEIKTVDSLESLNGSVLVMVTGSLSNHGHPRRNFVQTFFLAPQEVGYFVLNDMFRYLDGEPNPLQPLAPTINSNSEEYIPAPKQGVVDVQPSPKQEAIDNAIPSSVEVHPMQQQDQVLEEELAPEVVEVVEVLEVVAPSEVVDVSTPSEEQVPPVPEEANMEEAPKKSYASILRVRTDASNASAPTPMKSTPSKNDWRTVPSSATQLVLASAAPNFASDAASEGWGESTATELEGNGRSVYVKNLPLAITFTELEDEFKKFGSIKPGGVNLRNQRVGVCFAFIDYDEPSSAQSAIEASPILIGGRQVYIEEKKLIPMAQRALRGQFNQGRGYQQDGMRGRGYFGGRGFGRGNGQDFDREGGRGSGVGRGNYGGANSSVSSSYRSSFNTVNGYRRADSHGPRPVRRGAGNQVGHGRELAQE